MLALIKLGSRSTTMFEKNVGKIVLHIVVNVTLIVFYVFFFGLPSFSKYLNKAVIITNLEDTPSVIPSRGRYYEIDIIRHTNKNENQY